MTDTDISADLVQVSAARTSSFVDSIGINTHMGSWNTAWGVGNGIWAGAEAKVLAELQYVGIKNIRDSVPQGGTIAEMSDLGNDGYKFDLVQRVNSGLVGLATDIATITSMAVLAPGAVVSYEGANEYNSNSYDLNGQYSYGNLSWGAYDDQVTQAALNSSGLGSLTYVAASTGSVASAPDVGSYVDASNWHVYGGNGQQLGSNLTAAIAAAAATAPGKPVIITETGISSASPYVTNWGSSGDEYTQGLIDTNAVLDGFKDGASQTFLYDLMDDTQDASLEDNFGLFNADGSAKAGATDIHNLTTILADTGTSASSFGTSSLDLSVSGLPSTASDMLLEKSSGAYDLVLWNAGATVWNTSTNSEETPATSTVTVQLGATYQTVKVYDPLVSSSALQTLSDVSSVSVGLSKDPLIIELSAIPAPTSIGAGAQTFTLQMSEDAWEGNAQFTVAVDGQQIGGTQTVVASHAAGQSQEFDVWGNWSTGAHQVTVSFLNDAYGGSTSTDRNLYVNSASSDGSEIAGAPSTFLWTGSHYFTLPSSDVTAADATQEATASTQAVSTAGAIQASVTPSVYNFADGQDHTLTTASTATDLITLGTGRATLITQGTDTVVAGSGFSTISAVSGSLSVTGGSGSMTFIQGAASSNVSLGSGAALIDIVQGMAGGSLTLSGFAEGKDYIHLSGYAGTGIQSEQVIQGSTQLILTDNTRIELSNFVASNAHSLFS